MALVLLGNNGNPYGIYDGYDSLSLLGGEVVTLTSLPVANADKRAKDEDGYSVAGGTQVRPVVTNVVPTGAAGAQLFLADEGISGYGTLFGSLVGGIAGQQMTPTQLGPNTMAGSGKVTLWANPGMYGVTLDALDSSMTTASDLVVGAVLGFTPSTGKIAAPGSSTTKVARFVEFATNGSLVTTPGSLTRVGISGGMKSFKYAVIHWHPGVSV